MDTTKRDAQILTSQGDSPEQVAANLGLTVEQVHKLVGTKAKAEPKPEPKGDPDTPPAPATPAAPTPPGPKRAG